MTIHNTEIASIFNRLADLLEIGNENPFRIRAYRNAAMTITGLSKNVADLVKENADLSELPGIGKDLADKIKIIVLTGELPLLQEIEKKIPAVLCELLKIEGLGPKRVRAIYLNLNIRSVADLKKCIENGKLRSLKGFGEKTEANILAGIQHIKEASERLKLSDSISIANNLINYLKKCKDVIKVECAGSFRRRKETVGDLDLVASSKNTKRVIEYFSKFDEISAVLSKGETRSSVRIHSGIRVDLRVVAPDSYGAALIYFTGSKNHNIAIRKIALKKKLKINEYGVFKGKKQISGKTETEVYRQIGLPYIEPEMRENNGEIELAKDNKLPHLITLEDICGDLHCHTKATDGSATIAEMAQKAQELNYEYLAITDHSKHLAMVFGLNKKSLFQQIKLIDKLNSKLKKIVILKSIEVDILENGDLDLPNDVLKELDFTVCAIHSKFNLTKKQQTKRILRAMDNPYFNIFAHPTGQIINKRQPYHLDIEKIMLSAKERNCYLELNAQPGRLDLNHVYCRLAKALGLKVVISTDAHSVTQMEGMRYGIYEARRGWLERKDVLNTYSLQDLIKAFKRK
ncbi:MAG: DNA polymerase/3'-5' exonuclease PolX [Gammaproteobacteria bacterium]